MRIIRLLLLSSVLSINLAAADLISFETSGLTECLNSGVLCDLFEDQTGLSIQEGRVPFSSIFTIDTSVPAELSGGIDGAKYRGGPGTGISITIGKLTLFKTDLVTEIVGEAGRYHTIKFYSGACCDDFLFHEFSADGNSSGLSEATLTALASEDLSVFERTFFGTYAIPPGPTWQTHGAGEYIRRVSEPGISLWLLTAIILVGRVLGRQLTVRKYGF